MTECRAKTCSFRPSLGAGYMRTSRLQLRDEMFPLALHALSRVVLPSLFLLEELQKRACCVLTSMLRVDRYEVGHTHLSPEMSEIGCISEICERLIFCRRCRSLVVICKICGYLSVCLVLTITTLLHPTRYLGEVAVSTSLVNQLSDWY